MASGTNDVLQNIEKLQDNDSSVFLEASEILIKFANNVINNPRNQKYRKIRVGNPIVVEKLLPVNGAVECLFAIGFQEDDEFFTLPFTAPVDKIILFRDKLQELRSKKQQPLMAAAARTPVTAPNPGMQNNFMSQAAFLKKIMGSFDHVLIYEDQNLQAKARNLIPVKDLTDSAIEKQTSLLNQGETVQLQDLILLELLAWFKIIFFRWTDAPKCERCNSNTRNIGMVPPTPAESTWGAGRVENYQCTSCQAHTRFPRYNHPGKLLDTRCGRCGEWANCFTLCCRAMGFEARYVLDWTDHVWTEVFSESQNRWLHCDPCENSCDKPLVYEIGWKKKLSYIIAFSKDEVQDVTWRYSVNHEDLLTRRTEASESFVLSTINRLRSQRQQKLPESRKKQLLDRMVVEIVEFMSPKKAAEGETDGRQSGSMAWRLARGETMGAGSSKKTGGFIIRPTENEIKSKVIHIQYCCAGDKYVRVTDNSSVVKGWESMVFEALNIQKKMEHDWNMVYLAREEGADTATMSWKFDLQDCEISKIEVEAQSTCYENGQICWRMCAGEQCAILRKDGRRTKVNSLSGCKELTLTAELSKGKGDVAWQHTQLFRQSDTDTDNFPLDITIYLK